MAVWASVVFLIVSLSIAAGVRQNVAVNKPAWMSTTRQPSQSAANAVDGVTTANSETFSIHTKGGESTAWWKVDLQTQVQSARVIIYFRADYQAGRNGLQLYTSVTNSSDPKEGSLCHTVTGRPDGADIPDVLNVTCPGTWRYLTAFTKTDNDGRGAVLDFAEVQVWTCTSGYYGSNCDQRCDARHCKSDSSCDGQGQCVGGCAAGYQGTDCIQACGPGTFGEGCSKSCSNRRCKTWSATCNHTTGVCPDGCASGSMGDNCLQSCTSGRTYGPNCASDCSSRHCKTRPSTCDINTGQCTAGCEDGWTETDCSKACNPGTYGEECRKFCRSRRCKTPSNTCNNMTGVCSDGCESGYTGEDCVQTCTWGMYGPNCASECSSRHCKTRSSRCDSVTGQCPDGCEDGWTGTDCTRNCADGFYGNNCSLKCADRHCTSTSCLGDGVCSVGCDVGWTLQDCTQVCPRGTYGVKCESTCRHCADNNTCHHVTGACPGGCQAGWQLDPCPTGCDNGKFGVNCESDCGHCNGTCDAVDGRCLWGCVEGYNGSHCSVKLGLIGGAESQRGSAITPATAGIIGLAAGICFMLILGVGLYLGLVRQGRLQWISSSQKDAVKVKESQVPVDKDTTQPSDNYTSISEQAGGRNIYNNDYAALDVEAKANNEYDVIKNQAYENL